MEREPTRRGLLRGIPQNIARTFARLLPRKGRDGEGAAVADAARDALAVLEELQVGRRPDYCLYVGPTRAKSADPDMEHLLASGFAPLPWLPVDGYKSPLRRLPTEGRMAEEAFGTLATHARVLLIVPSDQPQTLSRVRWLRDHGHLWRAIFFMPDAGAFGIDDWTAAWQTAQQALAALGLELPPYTAGGWLFRYAVEGRDTEGKDAEVTGAAGATGPGPRACTFRMIVHPNPEKIAKALDAICEEMSAESPVR